MTGASAVHILLVEDNPADAEITLRSLHAFNVTNKVLWLKDGAAALDYFFGPEAAANGVPMPRLVLLDLRLPKVDGLEVLSKLKSSECTRSLPVVILTSSTQDEDILRSYNLNVNSYVSKPVNFEEFAKVVAQLGLYWTLVNRFPGP